MSLVCVFSKFPRSNFLVLRSKIWFPSRIGPLSILSKSWLSWHWPMQTRTQNCVVILTQNLPFFVPTEKYKVHHSSPRNPRAFWYTVYFRSPRISQQTSREILKSHQSERKGCRSLPFLQNIKILHGTVITPPLPPPPTESRVYTRLWTNQFRRYKGAVPASFLQKGKRIM